MLCFPRNIIQALSKHCPNNFSLGPKINLIVKELEPSNEGVTKFYLIFDDYLVELQLRN